MNPPSLQTAINRRSTHSIEAIIAGDRYAVCLPQEGSRRVQSEQALLGTAQ